MVDGKFVEHWSNSDDPEHDAAVWSDPAAASAVMKDLPLTIRNWRLAIGDAAKA